jgi:hypothetical protein
MLYTDARSHKAQPSRSEVRKRALRRQLAETRSLDEPLAVLTRLARERRQTIPSIVIPPHVQWRIVDYATERWAASTILERPEFGAKVKFSVRERAGLEARTAWMATDPPITDGDFLLETLRIAQHPRSGSAPIHLLGNRPSLVVAVIEHDLVPLLPAAARHTRSLEQHARLIEALMTTDELRVRDWALDLFADRTDVSWVLRRRAERALRRIDGSRRPDIGAITSAWDALGFVEAGSDSTALAELSPDVVRTRRAAAQVLAAGARLPDSTLATARSTAQRIVAARLCQAAADRVTELGPVPTELLKSITTHPLGLALVGERSPASTCRPSVPPPSRAQEEQAEAPTEPRIYRATPDGAVVAVSDA